MFSCDSCGEPTMKYDYQDKKYYCTECDYEILIRPKETRCIRCGTKYTEYTWFDPSGCTNCNKSFVD